MNIGPSSVHGSRRTLVITALSVPIALFLAGGLLPAFAQKAAGVAARQEVDFGFAELDPGGPAVPIPSYKRGGAMVVYAGEELQFQVEGERPLPQLELRIGDVVYRLQDAKGKVEIVGAALQPLPAVLRAGGARLSLPGGAPPRIAVKVQVFGAARPAR